MYQCTLPALVPAAAYFLSCRRRQRKTVRRFSLCAMLLRRKHFLLKLKKQPQAKALEAASSSSDGEGFCVYALMCSVCLEASESRRGVPTTGPTASRARSDNDAQTQAHHARGVCAPHLDADEPRPCPSPTQALREFYKQFPMVPIPADEADKHKAELDALCAEIGLEGSKIPELVGLPVPTRIDDIFWRNRCFLEEIEFNLSIVAKHGQLNCSKVQSDLLDAEKRIRMVQQNNTEAAAAQIKQFLPQDFRGTLLQMRQAAGEKKNQKEIDDLVKRGGSIREKYELYLKQVSEGSR